MCSEVKLLVHCVVDGVIVQLAKSRVLPFVKLPTHVIITYAGLQTFPDTASSDWPSRESPSLSSCLSVKYCQVGLVVL